MPRCLMALLFATLSCGVGIAEQAQVYGGPSQSTTSPVDARFEVVSSPLAAQWTFRLDRVTGHISHLVTAGDGDPKWEDVPVMGLPAVTANDNRAVEVVSRCGRCRVVGLTYR